MPYPFPARFSDPAAARARLCTICVCGLNPGPTVRRTHSALIRVDSRLVLQAGAALAAAVAEVDLAVDMKRSAAQGSSRRIGLRVTVGAGTGVMAGWGRTVAITASDGRRRRGPRDMRFRAALGMARHGAAPGRRVVARLAWDEGGVERDFHGAVTVQASDDSGTRHRVARRAGQSRRAYGRRLDGRGMRPGDVAREEAWSARGVVWQRVAVLGRPQPVRIRPRRGRRYGGDRRFGRAVAKSARPPAARTTGSATNDARRIDMDVRVCGIRAGGSTATATA